MDQLINLAWTQHLLAASTDRQVIFSIIWSTQKWMRYFFPLHLNGGWVLTRKWILRNCKNGSVICITTAVKSSKPTTDANTVFPISTHVILTDSQRCPSRSFFKFLCCTKSETTSSGGKSEREKAATILPQRQPQLTFQRLGPVSTRTHTQRQRQRNRLKKM